MDLKPGQRKCIETLAGPVAVSAGAGSGKTFTLTRRIVHALATGQVEGVDRVLAITFTAKAAAELKSRVRGALRAEGLVGEALKVDAAWISTIHGACARILRSHALELGIDPAFTVLSEDEASPLLDAAIDEVLSSANEFVSPEGFDALFAEYPARSHGPRGGGSVEDMVRELVRAASAHPDGADALVLPKPADPGQLVRRMVEAAEELLVQAQGQKQGTRRDAFVQGTEEALEACRDALAAGLAEQELPLLLNRFPVPGKGFGTKEFKEYAADAAQVYLECMAAARFGAAVPLLADLRQVAARVMEAYRGRKRKAGGLDNDDLLIEASRALARHPSIAAEYAERFQMVMVDEFQDTDQVQVDMIKRMCGPGCVRLCTVGDAQQSIYRFRGADVSVYNRHVAQVRRTSPEGLIQLPDNFRSHADVLAFADRIFGQRQVFGESFMSLAPARDESRVARPYRGAGPRIDVQLVTRPYSGVSPDEACRVAAEGIAGRFAALREAGHAAGDMVVLLGSTTRAGVYADALRAAGFACVVVKGSIFNRAPEVRLMSRLAQAIANPLDSLALFEVLSSDLFVLSADDFLVLGSYRDEETGTWRRRPLFSGLRAAAADPAALSPQLAAAVRVVGDMAADAGRRPMARIMADAVRQSGWITRQERQGAEGQARVANVLKAIRAMEDIERGGDVGPARAAAQLALRIEVAREAPGALSASGGDFVRIMTVHASKGLEFPIVAVAELRQGDAAVRKLVCEGVEGKLYTSLDLGNSVSQAAGSSLLEKCRQASFGTGELDAEKLDAAVQDAPEAARLRAALRAREASCEAEEARRLLYVALTRAKEALIVSLCGKRTKDDPSGASKGVSGDIQSAICGQGGVFPEGTAMLDFGGSRPAAFERIDLEKDGTAPGDGLAGDPVGGSAADAGETGPAGMPACRFCEPAAAAGHAAVQPVSGAAGAGELVEVYAAEPRTPDRDRPYSPVRDGVFSYSSIAPAGHGGDADAEKPGAAGGLSGSAPAADAACGGGLLAEGLAGAGAPLHTGASQGASPVQGALPQGATWGDADDDAWDRICGSLTNEADATDLGTAFHRLAQWAVEQRRPDGALALPPEDRVGALCRACGLGAGQRSRLAAALGRWFGSDVAAQAAAHGTVRAEVPFFQALRDGQRDIFLEGEIDLLATDGPLGSALIVDYKTGGRPDEDAAQLHGKHLLQASCYAYAVLCQGYSQVDAVFVRVEQEDTAAAGQPQCVRYSFAAQDVPALSEAIVAAYRRAQG